MGWAYGSQTLAAIIGVPVLTAIGAVAGWRPAFIAVAGVGLVILAIASVWLPRPGHRSFDPLHLATLTAPYRPLLRDPTMRRLYGARALGALTFYGFVTYLGAFLAQTLGMTTAHAGLVYMVSGSGFFLGTLAVGGPLAQFPARRLVVSGYAAMALLLGLAFSARLGVTGTIILITAAAAATGMASVSIVSLFLAETPSGAGTTVSLSASVFNVGAAAGGVIGGPCSRMPGTTRWRLDCRSSAWPQRSYVGGQHRFLGTASLMADERAWNRERRAWHDDDAGTGSADGRHLAVSRRGDPRLVWTVPRLLPRRPPPRHGGRSGTLALHRDRHRRDGRSDHQLRWPVGGWSRSWNAGATGPHARKSSPS